MIAAVKLYILNVLIAADMLGCALFYPQCDETISSRTLFAYYSGKWWGIALYHVLDWLEPGHCEDAVRNDIKRARAAIHDLRHDMREIGQ